MSLVGIVKPVYTTKAKMKIAAGGMAWWRDLLTAAIVLKMLLMTSVVVKENKKKMKNAPGSRRRLVMKYSVKLNDKAVKILAGISQIMEETASENG